MRTTTIGRRAFCRPREVAEHFLVDVRTVRYWIAKGDLKAVKVGQGWRIPIAELHRLAGSTEAA